MVHLRDDGDLDQSDKSKGVRKWLDLYFTQKIGLVYKLWPG